MPDAGEAEKQANGAPGLLLGKEVETLVDRSHDIRREIDRLEAELRELKAKCQDLLAARTETDAQST